MKVDMRDLREGPLTLELEYTPESLELSDEEFRFTHPVTGQVTFQLVGPKVLARGWLKTIASSDCVRCLTNADVPLNAVVDAVYENDPELLKPEAKAIGNAELSISWFDGDSISPEPELRESLMLELPSFPVCSEDCKGLCPNCGANLNSENCRCGGANAEVSTWKTALKDLKLD